MDARTYDAIAARAYRIWEEEGKPVGRAEEHWNRAKDEVQREAAVDPMAAAVELPTEAAASANGAGPRTGGPTLPEPAGPQAANDSEPPAVPPVPKRARSKLAKSGGAPARGAKP